MHSTMTKAVDECYAEWSARYFEEYYGCDAPYPPVHVELIVRELTAAGARTVLDAGCGPASILRTLVSKGFDCWGFDLTPEMVTEGQAVLRDVGVPASRIWQGDAANASAYRNRAAGAPAMFDAVTAIGVMPHLEDNQVEAMFAHLHSAARPGGTVIVQARNALFSLFTFNRYTHEFVRDELLRTDDAADERGKAFLTEAAEHIEQCMRMDLPPQRPSSQYDATRPRAHNPLTLPAQLAAHGFADVETLFYHYHAAPPMCEASDAETFRRLSIERENPRDWRGYFMASSFMLVARRT